MPNLKVEVGGLKNLEKGEFQCIVSNGKSKQKTKVGKAKKGSMLHFIVLKTVVYNVFSIFKLTRLLLYLMSSN